MIVRRKRSIPLFCMLLTTAIFLVCSAAAFGAEPGRLVTAKWLAEKIDDPNLVIIDVSPTKEYLKGHIKNAVSGSFSAQDNMSYGIDTSYGGNDLINDPDTTIPWEDGPDAYVQNVMQTLGVNNESTVVVCDEGAHFHATRFYWTLTSNGQQNAYILDGGMAKWTEEKLPVVQEAPKVKKGNFAIRKVSPSPVVSTDYVISKQFNPDTRIVYAVTSNWFYGGLLAYDKPGHIPGSLMVSYPDYFQKDKRWKSVDDLKKMFLAQGVTPDKECIVYCGGNPAASSLYFTMHHVLGYPNVKYYTGSTVAWLKDRRDLPLHTFQNQQLLRNPLWVRWWAGKRIQYLVSDPGVLVVDVRPSNSYKAGHIPYAVNIPVVETMAKAGTKADEWAKVLGANGAGLDKEIVICSDATDPSAALMFWLLEYFGYPRVSILDGGMAAWKNTNLETTAAETVIAPPKTKYDVAISPVTCTLAVQENIRLADPGQKVDFFGYPRLWITASADDKPLPFNEPGVQAKHLAWKDNFSQDGTIAFASQLIDRYEKASVVKYAEIACYSEEPSEAACTYFTLRALGYPNVRVYLPK